MEDDKLTWIANQIFAAFPKEVTGLKFYILDCGCIYYQRVYKDGILDPKIGIYRDAEHGPCEICMMQEDTWRDRMTDETFIYNHSFQALLHKKLH